NEQKHGKYTSPREPWIQSLASLCNIFGMSEEVTLKFMLEFFSNHPESLNPQKPIRIETYIEKPVKDVYIRYAHQHNSWLQEEHKQDTPCLPDEIFSQLPSFLPKLCN